MTKIYYNMSYNIHPNDILSLIFDDSDIFIFYNIIYNTIIYDL